MEENRCEACWMSLDPMPGETIFCTRTRDGRALCFHCIAEAIMETAIQQQSDKRYFRRKAEIEEEQRASRPSMNEMMNTVPLDPLVRLREQE